MNPLAEDSHDISSLTFSEKNEKVFMDVVISALRVNFVKVGTDCIVCYLQFWKAELVIC